MDTVAVWATISITREAMSLLFVSIIKNRIANKVKNTLIIKPFLNLARKWGNFPFAHARKRRAWTMERCQREREREVGFLHAGTASKPVKFRTEQRRSISAQRKQLTLRFNVNYAFWPV